MTKTSILAKLFALALCVTASTAAVAQYVWLDEQGIKQFSDQPPPPSVPKNKILKFSGKPIVTEGTNADTSVDSGPAPVAKAPESTADKELAYRKRRDEQNKKNQQVEDLAKVNATKIDNCNRMRQYQQSLTSGQRIPQIDLNGNRSYMGDDRRAEELSRLNQNLGDCSN